MVRSAIGPAEAAKLVKLGYTKLFGVHGGRRSAHDLHRRRSHSSLAQSALSR